MKSTILPLPTALLWIIGSTLVVTGSAYSIMKGVGREHRGEKEHFIYKIIQTGPHTDALKTDYLAEMMELSSDHPTPVRTFNAHQVTRKLLQMPMIKEVVVSVLPPDTVYVDYTLRQPIAMLYDYENVAVDEEGFLFPFFPFFSPKMLPEFYFGPQLQRDERTVFHQPVEGREWLLIMRVLTLLRPVATDYAVSIKRIDVSHAFEASLGRQEIVVDLVNEEACLLSKQRFFHRLRLHPQDYEQQLGNYFVLHQELLSDQGNEERVIDLRMQGLALIQEH
jgi:hypothetical protein